MVYLNHLKITIGMSRKKTGFRNLWSLTLLSLLRIRPMHPYEMQRLIKLFHKDDFLNLKRGSLYNSIDQLLRAELIAVLEITRAGRRPERTIYQITEKGRHELVEWLRQLLATPTPDPIQFFAALSFLPVLEPEDVIQQLEHRSGLLATEMKNFKTVLKKMIPEIGRLVLVEVEYSLAMRTAEWKWVRAIIADLRSRKLNWDPEAILEGTSKLFEMKNLKTRKTSKKVSFNPELCN